jgi:acetyltransferase-like isoleucine patch superfamily enzyme
MIGTTRRIVRGLRDRWDQFRLSGPDYARKLGVTVGERCIVLTREFGSEPFLITLGDDVNIAHGTVFLTHDGACHNISDERGRRYYCRAIRIGNRSFVGYRTILLPGVEIGEDVMVGAGSVVTKSVPSGLIVAGNPARVIGTFAEYERWALETCVAEADLAGLSGHYARVMRMLTPGYNDPVKT